MESYVIDKWNEQLDSFPVEYRDIYFREEYVRLYQGPSEKAVCFVYQDDNKYMLFPYLERSFEFAGELYHDFETVYGYGGPIYNTDCLEFKRSAQIEMYKYLASRKYVAGFIRFHPLIDNASDFILGQVIKDRKTVALDLLLSEQEIWEEQLNSRNRRNIRKAEKNGLVFVADYGYTYFEDFLKLYNSTMDRLSAEDFYFFNSHYYEAFKESFVNNSFLGVVLKDNKVLSAGIFMYYGLYGHYHLAGSDASALDLRPNNMLLYNAALELKKLGVRWYHFGGGTTSSEEDSLFWFKSSFSKSLFQYCLGKIVFDESVYYKICSDWESTNPDKKEKYKFYLLKYKY